MQRERDLAQRIAELEAENRRMREALKEAEHRKSLIAIERDHYRHGLWWLVNALDGKCNDLQEALEYARGELGD